MHGLVSLNEGRTAAVVVATMGKQDLYLR